MAAALDSDLNAPPNGTDLAAADNDTSPTRANSEGISRLKRTACVLCRKRKLKCDAMRPKCSTCHRLGHECEYNEVRKKSGPKRGYVKALEARLASVETQLKTSTAGNDIGNGLSNGSPSSSGPKTMNRYPPASNTNPQIFPNNDSTSPELEWGAELGDSPAIPPLKVEYKESYSWDMIALGLEEPLPTQEAMTDLYNIYFEKVHPNTAMIHRGRFMASLNYSPQMRPPITLRYAMWTLAAAVSDKYSNMQEHFYHRARKYAQADEMRGFGESIVSLYYTQAWILLCIHEFKNMHFPRAWLSTGRAVRLGQMQGLHRLDGAGLDVKQCLQPPKDWIEREERRRTFWMTFWEDRCASIGTGWPMTIDEADILTNLPASDEAFHSGTPEQTPSLKEVITAQYTNFSNFGGAILLTALFGRNLIHLHRPSPDDREDDLNGGFWDRHRAIDAILLNISMNLPDNQRIPKGLPDSNVIYLNMCIHTSIICLHQAAIFKIDKNNLPASLGHESKIRCVTAAAEVASIMRSVSHCELASMNPFTAFCLYVASRVFVQYLKSRPNDQNIYSSLTFLLSAMNAMKRKNPLSESFLAQLEVDLEAANIKIPTWNAMENLHKRGIYPLKHPNGETVDPSTCRPGGLLDPTGSQPSTTIPTNMKVNIGSANVSEMTLPYNQTQFPDGTNVSYLPDSSIGILDSSISENSRTASITVEEMDLSPENSANASTPSVFTHRSGSTGGTAYTPPHNADSAGNEKPAAQQWQQNQDSSTSTSTNSTQTQTHSQFEASQESFYSFQKDFQMFEDGPGLSPKNPVTAPSPMSQQDFENLTRQFFPSTPGAGDYLASLGPTGLTPGPGTDDWNQVLEGMLGWENDNARPGAPWTTSGRP